jgi:iron complex transport system permease protein
VDQTVNAVAAQRRWLKNQTRGTAEAPRVSPSLLFPVLAAALVIAVVVSIGIGTVRIPPQQVVAIILDHLGLDLDVAYTRQQDSVVWSIRLPRVVLAVMVGAGLALSGAALQGMFRNPLADPGLIGVSSGAALGAVTALGLGVSWFGLATTPVFAFAGGVTTAIIGYGLARHHGRTEVVTLVLAGVALNTFAGAGTSLVTFIANDAQLRAIIFWSLGSLGSATWTACSPPCRFWR